MGFLGAVAYAGAGGNLVASHSFYVQDEGLGMAKGVDSQVSAANSKLKVINGEMIDLDKTNVRRFREWFRVVAIEQFISFWGLGLLSIVVLGIISYSLAFPFSGEENLEFIFLQADGLYEQFGGLLSNLFLITGAVFLFTTQLGIFESTSRIMTENIQLASKKITQSFSRSRIFFFFLWTQITIAAVISFSEVSAPFQILLTSTFFSALSMLVLAGLIFFVNVSNLLPKELKAGRFRKTIIALTIIFFSIFVILTLIDSLK
jgi:hypothetical protein